MNVTLIDTSHRDRPALDITASVVISDSDGIVILGAHIHPNYETIDDPAIPTSITSLVRDILQGWTLNLSHDWIIRVHD